MSKNGKTIGQYWDSFSTTKRVVIVLVALGVLGGIAGGGKPNPCDCTEVMNRKSYVGFYNLSNSNQKLYNKCANSYWDRNAANRECMNKVERDYYNN